MHRAPEFSEVIFHFLRVSLSGQFGIWFCKDHNTLILKKSWKEVVLTLITCAFSSPKDSQGSTHQQHRVYLVSFGLLGRGRTLSRAFLCSGVWYNDSRSPTAEPENAFSCWWMRGMKTCGLFPVIQPLSSSSVSWPVLALPHLMALDNSQKWLFHSPVYQRACCSPSARFSKVIIKGLISPYSLSVTYNLLLIPLKRNFPL